MTSIVVHYQEIALKGKNRPWFLARLVRNLRQAVSDLDVQSVRALMGRIEIVLGPSAAPEAVGDRIRRDLRRGELLVCVPNRPGPRRDRRPRSSRTLAIGRARASVSRCAVRTSGFR